MKTKICMKCGTKVSYNAVYCPECGVNIKKYAKTNAYAIKKGLKGYKAKQGLYEPKKPQFGVGTLIIIVIFLIGFFPLGIVIGILAWFSYKKKIDEWQQERLIYKLDHPKQGN